MLGSFCPFGQLIRCRQRNHWHAHSTGSDVIKGESFSRGTQGKLFESAVAAQYSRQLYPTYCSRDYSMSGIAGYRDRSVHSSGEENLFLPS